MDDYKILKQLGQGAFGKAFLVQNIIDSQILAVKELHPSISHRSRTIQEIMIIKQLSHENIIKFDHYIVEDKQILIFMEYANGGCVDPKKLLNESILKLYLVQILLALQYLHHEKHVIHRDIKPDNILLNNGVVKLCDFGFSKELDSTWQQAKSILGTPVYCAPEIAHRNKYTNKCDVWSLGVLLYQMLTGELPFCAKNMPELLKKIDKGKFKKIKGNFSAELIDLQAQMLQLDPDSRPGVQDILETGFFNNELLYLQKQYIKKGKEDYLDQLRQFIKH